MNQYLSFTKYLRNVNNTKEYDQDEKTEKWNQKKTEEMQGAENQPTNQPTNQPNKQNTSWIVNTEQK